MQAAGAVRRFSELNKKQQHDVALGVIGILMVMMIPLPTLLLDILLSFSITVSIIILLMSMYVLKPLISPFFLQFFLLSLY
jgi:flagellar biosynthesis protein FlhA